MRIKHRCNSIVYIIFLLISIGSCDVLNLKPKSELTEANFYQTSDQLNKAVLGVYSRYQSRIPRDWSLLEMPTDELYKSQYHFIGGLKALDNMNFQPTNDIIWNFWQNSYNGIFRANAVLTNINAPEDYTGSMKKQLGGEAKFMQALFYFDLVRVFGGVPKVSKKLSIKESKNIPRAPEKEIYDFIVSNLKDAIEKLPTQDKIAKGRATKGAATALLGKVYIYRKDWQKALTHLNKVSQFNYHLLDDYSSLWKLKNEDNPEVIFAMKYIENQNGQAISSDFLPYYGVEGIVSHGREQALPGWSLIKKFDADDKRKQVTVTEYWRKPGSSGSKEWNPYVSKYAVPHTYNSSGLDLSVLRYDDIILLKAEALYRLGQHKKALTELNRIRTRAFGNTSHNYNISDISTLDDFLDKLLLERQLEFAYENERWFDLVRTGRFVQVLSQVERSYNPNTQEPQVVNLEVKPYYNRFPIPQRAIDRANPGVIKQNEGY